MIKFFRRIRRKLLDEGRLTKLVSPAGRYFIYAVGEIFLVVIGILIALQINNWDEGNKQLRTSHEILREIKRNVAFNTLQFQEEIEMEKKVISAIDIVKQNISQTKIYNDTLDKYFHLCMFWPASTWKTSGYETLKSQGIEIVERETLRELIVDLYEVSYAQIAEIIRSSEGDSYNVMMPVFTEFMDVTPANIEQPFEEFRAKPSDYEKLISSGKFEGPLSFWRTLRVVAIQVRLNAIEKNRILIEEIEKELNRS